MEEIENILRILKETEKAIKINDATSIKNLSNETINSAALTGDQDNITVAVIIYSIGKIFERKNYMALKGWDGFKRTIISSIGMSIKDLKENNIKKFQKDFNLITKAVNKISGKLKKYIKEVLDKAKINKGSRIHEHGISLETTAKMLGISMFDLQSYTGKTGISEIALNKTVDTESRIKILEELFSK